MRLQIHETPDDFGDEVLNVRTGVEVVARMRSDTDSASAPAAELILQSSGWAAPQAELVRRLGRQSAGCEPPKEIAIRCERVE